MNKIELLSTIAKVNKALESNDYGQLALALGMTKAMVEEMSINDIMEAMTVRMADLNRELEKVLNK
jgi:hypothetical protein